MVIVVVNVLSIARDVQSYAGHCQKYCERGAAIAYEWQWHACERNDSGYRCHIYEGLYCDDCPKADQDQSPKLIGCFSGKPIEAERVHAKKCDKNAGADE